MRTSLNRLVASGCPFLVIKDLNSSAVALAVFRDPSICRRLMIIASTTDDLNATMTSIITGGRCFENKVQPLHQYFIRKFELGERVAPKFAA